MGAGIGFSRDAQASAERNRSLRKQKEPFQIAKGNQFSKKNKKILSFKNATPEQLEALRSELKAKNKRQTMLQVAIFLLVLAGFVWLLFAPIF